MIYHYKKMSDNDSPKSSQNSTPKMKSNFFSEPNESFPTSINNLSNNRNTLILQPNYIINEAINIIIPESEQRSTAQETFQKKELAPEITNIVANLDLGEKLDLREIALSCMNTEYNQKYNFAVMRIRKPKATANIYRTGEITLLGTKNENDFNKASEKIRKILAKNLKKKFFLKKTKIVNFNATCNFGIQIDLIRLSEGLFEEFNKNPNKKEYVVNYDPEIFPGLRFKSEDSKLALIFFASGKVNIVGAKNREDIKEALDKVYPIVVECQLEIPKKKDKELNNFDNIKKVN